MHIPLWTRWDFAAALVILYCCTLCWVRIFWSFCYIYSVKQRWTKARRSLLIPGLCIDSTLLCCCGKYSFSTQRDREGSMDVSLAEGKSHFSSVAGAVKHMQPFKASRKVLSSQRSDWKVIILSHFIFYSALVKLFSRVPLIYIFTGLLWYSCKKAWGKWKSINVWTQSSSPEQGAEKTIELPWWFVLQQCTVSYLWLQYLVAITWYSFEVLARFFFSFINVQWKCLDSYFCKQFSEYTLASNLVY